MQSSSLLSNLSLCWTNTNKPEPISLTYPPRSLRTSPTHTQLITTTLPERIEILISILLIIVNTTNLKRSMVQTFRVFFLGPQKERQAAAPPTRRTPVQMELGGRGAPAPLPPRSARGPSRVSRPWVASRRHLQPP